MSVIGAASGMLFVGILAAIGIAIAAGIATETYVKYLSLADVIEELKKYKNIKQEDKENRIGFQIKQQMQSGHMNVICGIWDKKAEKILAATSFEAEAIDNALREAEELVIYS